MRSLSLNSALVWTASWWQLLYLLWIALMGMMVGFYAIDFLLRAWAVDEFTGILLRNLAVQLGMLLAFFTFAPLSRRDVSICTLPWRKGFKVALYTLLACFPLLILTQWIVRIILLYFGVELEEQKLVSMIREIDSVPLIVLTFVMTVVLAPLTEEWLFRAGVYRFLKAHTQTWIAALISATLFSLVHFNITSFLPLLLLALVLTYSYETSGSIRLPILIHALFNTNTMIMLMLK